jgi:hypothetical protein
LNRTWTFWTREPLRIFDTFDIIWWYILCIILYNVWQGTPNKSS